MNHSTFLTVEIHTRLGRESRAALATILEESLQTFLEDHVTVHDRGPIPLTGHKTADGSTYFLNLHPDQVISYEPTTYFLWRDGSAVLDEPQAGTKLEMYGTDGLYTVTVREPLERVQEIMKPYST